MEYKNYDKKQLITDKNYIFHVVEIFIVDNVIKQYCIKTFLDHEEAWVNTYNTAREQGDYLHPDMLKTLYLKGDRTRSHIFQHEWDMGTKYLFLSSKGLTCTYLEKTTIGSCFVPMTIKELKEYYKEHFNNPSY